MCVYVYVCMYVNVCVCVCDCVCVCVCAHSSCMWSNETVNIWSHMLGLVYFAVLLLDDLFSFLPENGAELNDYLTFALLDFCFMVRTCVRTYVHTRDT